MDDKIDFPVSDTWLDFYHEQGLTPRRSGRSNDYIAQELQYLHQELREIRLLLQLLFDKIDELPQRRHSKRRSNYVPEGMPEESLLVEE